MEACVHLETAFNNPRLHRLMTMVDASKLKYACLPNAVPIDNLFVLRFLLSFESCSDKEIMDKIEETFVWRSQMRGEITQLAEGDNTPVEFLDHVLCSGAMFDTKSAHVALSRWGHADFKRQSEWKKHISPKTTLSTLFLLWKERIFQHMDKRSRETGFLVKFVDVITFDNHPGLRYGLQNIPFLNEFSRANDLGTTYYPQFMSRVLLIDSNTKFINSMLSFAKPFLSTRTLEKVIILNKMIDGDDEMVVEDDFRKMLHFGKYSSLLGGKQQISLALQSKS